MKTIHEYLIDNGYSPAQDETTSHHDEWLNWYQGYVKDFHRYTVYNGVEMVGKDRYTLGMAKTISRTG